MEKLNGHIYILTGWEIVLFYLEVYSKQIKEIKSQRLENFLSRKGLSMSKFLSLCKFFFQIYFSLPFPSLSPSPFLPTPQSILFPFFFF